MALNDVETVIEQFTIIAANADLELITKLKAILDERVLDMAEVGTTGESTEEAATETA